MKRTTIILLALLGGGCAATHPVAVTTPVISVPEYRASAASSLCFDSPVMPAFALPGLDRTDRQPSAFLGYDQTVTESYFIFTDDDQFDFCGLGSYERQAIYVKSGIRTR